MKNRWAEEVRSSIVHEGSPGINLFITTVMQALNVMTNWQLQTNTSQQMFKVFAFGFDVWIKTILPLINCLINDLCSTQLTPVPDVSSGTLAEMHPTDLRDMPVSLSIWRISHLFNKIIQTAKSHSFCGT